jgi:hypothetical protein
LDLERRAARENKKSSTLVMSASHYTSLKNFIKKVSTTCSCGNDEEEKNLVVDVKVGKVVNIINTSLWV